MIDAFVCLHAMDNLNPEPKPKPEPKADKHKDDVSDFQQLLTNLLPASADEAKEPDDVTEKRLAALDKLIPKGGKQRAVGRMPKGVVPDIKAKPKAKTEAPKTGLISLPDSSGAGKSRLKDATVKPAAVRRSADQLNLGKQVKEMKADGQALTKPVQRKPAGDRPSRSLPDPSGIRAGQQARGKTNMPGLGDMEKQQYRTALEQKEAINPAKDGLQPMPDAKQAVLKPDGGETTPSSRPANGEAFTNVLNQTAQGAGANGNAASVTQAMPDWDIAQQIVQKATLITQQGKSMMEIQLKPEFLGKVKVQLAFSEGAVSAYLTAEKSQVSQLLGSMLQQIKTSLEDQGIRIDYLGVNVGDQNDEAGDFNNDDTRQNLYQYQAPHDLAEESPEEAIGGLYEVDYLA